VGTPLSGSEDIVAFIHAGEQDVAEVERPDAVVHPSSPMTCGLRALAMNNRRVLKRIVPAFVTRLGMSWPGYSNGGTRPVYGRGEGR
jgi:hypothetical protein